MKSKYFQSSQHLELLAAAAANLLLEFKTPEKDDKLTNNKTESNSVSSIANWFLHQLQNLD